jgi:hypothetical protein
MSDLTNLTPVEIDTELARIYTETAKLEARIHGYIREIDRIRESKFGTLAAVDKVNALLEQAQEARLALAVESAPYQSEHHRRGWKRYFLVTNNNGHVHRGMDCVTCFPSTEYSWLVDLAGCDEDAMIEEWGERACTVCFPSAPTNPLYNRPARIDREERERRQAEREARQAARQAKLLTEMIKVPDGHGYSERIKTVAAAKQHIRDTITDDTFYGANEGRAQARQMCIEALLAKGGITQDEIDTLIDRATKKARKEARQ